MIKWISSFVETRQSSNKDEMSLVSTWSLVWDETTESVTTVTVSVSDVED